MSACAASVALPSLNLNLGTQSLCSTKSPISDAVRFSVSCGSTGFRSKPVSISSICGSFLTSENRLSYQVQNPSLFSRFVQNVAVSSDIEQDADIFLDDEEEQPYFPPECKLFVGNLPFSVDSSQLANLFENAGNVEMVEVIYDKTTGRSRGFGFVTMSNSEEVEAAAQQFNGYELGGRSLKVNSGPPPPKRNDAPSRGGRYGDFPSRGGRLGDVPARGSSFGSSFDSGNRLYVGNLAWGVDNEALGTLFSDVGNVLDAQVVYDRDSGRSRGFGFVTLSSADSVNKAIESLDGVDVDGRQIRVSVAEARPKRQY